MATPTPALRSLQEMRDEVINEKEKTEACTLSFWRFSDVDIWKALEEFATAPDWPYKDEGANEEDCRQELQSLFTKMNQAMVRQEKNLLWPNDPEPTPDEKQWSVVFGGKYAAVACSIGEQLVELLVSKGENTRVYTVSRKPMHEQISKAHPKNVIHFSKLNLEEDGGSVEFEEVMNRVVDDWEAENGLSISKDNHNNAKKIPIVFYFTLAKHKGVPFQKNILASSNFVQALEKIVPKRLLPNNIPWKVVITGTDATNPSTQKDPSFTVQGVPTTAPTYKMVPYNTVYAASKLCQFYSIATAVAKLTGTKITPILDLGRKDIDGSLGSISKQIEDYVLDAGDNGMYRENDYLTDRELDQISIYWTEVAEVSLSDYLHTAKHISICYTPLHRDPWTQICLTDKSKESPKKFMIENIVWRLKNAISIDKAARAHF